MCSIYPKPFAIKYVKEAVKYVFNAVYVFTICPGIPVGCTTWEAEQQPEPVGLVKYLLALSLLLVLLMLQTNVLSNAFIT